MRQPRRWAARQRFRAGRLGPANIYSAEAGIADTTDEALSYVRALELGDVDPVQAELYVRTASGVLQTIAKETPVAFQLQKGWPDYHSERDGGKEEGRSVAVGVVEAGRAALSAVRPDPDDAPPVAIPESADPPDAAEIARRKDSGVESRGRGLIAGLNAALHDLGGRCRP